MVGRDSLVQRDDRDRLDGVFTRQLLLESLLLTGLGAVLDVALAWGALSSRWDGL